MSACDKILRCGAWAFAGVLAVALGTGLAEAQSSLPPPPSFSSAYEREQTELLAEKRALTDQLDKLKAASAQRDKQARTEVDTLTLALADARREADDLESGITATQEEQTSLDHRDVLSSTIDVASLSLHKLGYDVPVDGDLPAVLERLFSRGVDAVREKSTVHARPGSFFDATGAEHRGTIVHIGRVASLGAAESAGGTLMPAPGGTLVVVDATLADLARKVAGGVALDGVPAHLYDPLSGPHEHRAKRTWIDTANAGGIIAWIIVALGGLTLLIVGERCTTLALASSRSDQIMRTVENAVESSGTIDESILAKERGALPRVLRAIAACGRAGREKMEEAAAEAIYLEMPRLERLLPFLAVIAGVAPLLGLLGTITGMIATFDVITEHGTGDPKLLSGGISEALITTEFGLIVAIPVLLLHNLLARWSDRTIDTLQTHALALVNRLEAKNPEG